MLTIRKLKIAYVAYTAFLLDISDLENLAINLIHDAERRKKS